MLHPQETAFVPHRVRTSRAFAPADLTRLTPTFLACFPRTTMKHFTSLVLFVVIGLTSLRSALGQEPHRVTFGAWHRTLQMAYVVGSEELGEALGRVGKEPDLLDRLDRER